MSDHLKGLMITAVGVLCVVPDSLFVRLISSEPLANAFWRASVAGGLILCFVLLTRGPGAIGGVRATGKFGILYGILMGSTAPGFVFAVQLTSVANVVFIFAATPIFAAIFSRLLLGERIQRRTIGTMVAVVFGLGIIAFGSTESTRAHWSGDLIALGVAMCFACAMTVARRVRDTPLIPVVALANLTVAALLFLVTDPFAGFGENWHLFLLHGAFVGCGSCLLTLGPRYISATEVSLLILLESVLAPLLVWAVIGEEPGRWTLLGGTIVISALVISNLIAIRKLK